MSAQMPFEPFPAARFCPVHLCEGQGMDRKAKAPPAPSRRRRYCRAKLRTVADLKAELAKLYREARDGRTPVEHASRLTNILAVLA